MSYTKRVMTNIASVHEQPEHESDRPVAYCHVIDEAVSTRDVQAVMALAGRQPVMLMGTHRPLADLFPASSFVQLTARTTSDMQRNQALQQYGELLGRELRTLGYSILHVPVARHGQGVFASDTEANSESLAALWSGLRIEGVAMCAELPSDGANGVDWQQLRYALVSGLPFVSVPCALARETVLAELMDTERFAGVACVSGLGASGLEGMALLDEAVRLLDMGWHALILDDVQADTAKALLHGLAERETGNQNAQQDATGRLNKRMSMLAGVEGRGEGAVALDRDADYMLKRRVLSHKLGIDDAYAFAERPARWGSMVRFHYRLQVDGEVRDENQDDGLRALLGKGQVIPGLETALVGRRKGDTFRLEIAPEDGYGVAEPGQIHRIPRSGILLAPGQRLQVGASAMIPGAGGVVQGRIISMDDEEVVVDANHELAGKTLVFDITIVDVV